MFNQSFDQSIIGAAPDLKAGDDDISIEHVQNYLKHYGYFAERSNFKKGKFDTPTIIALKKFQKQFGLEDSGELNPLTRAEMSAPRCGVPDVGSILDATTKGPWNRRNLTFAFGKLTNKVDKNIIRNAIRRAFNTWATVDVGLTFMEVNHNPDILIEWRPADDPDHSMVGGILAHGDFPPGFSMFVSAPPLPLHFNDSEHIWVDGAIISSFDIETVALHEIGHCLGMLHSNIEGSVMFPRIPPNFTLRTLQADDLAGIRSLYP